MQVAATIDDARKALLVQLIRAAPPRLSTTLGNTVAFSWMDGLLERFGHMSRLEAWPVMLLLTAYQGLEFALLSWGVVRVRARTGGSVTVSG